MDKEVRHWSSVVESNEVVIVNVQLFLKFTVIVTDELDTITYAP